MALTRSLAEPRLPGRPREFDLDRVLDGAIDAFSRNGFGATSITDLSAAMGLSQGSIYKAFGDKRAVLVAALDRYLAARADLLGPRLAASRSGRDRIELLLRYYAENSVDEAGQRGCLVIATLAELSCSDHELAQRLIGLLRSYETGFADAIRQGQKDGSVASRIDAGATAKLLLCVVQGMRVLGKTGRTKAEMRDLVSDTLTLLD